MERRQSGRLTVGERHKRHSYPREGFDFASVAGGAAVI